MMHPDVAITISRDRHDDRLCDAHLRRLARQARRVEVGRKPASNKD